MHPLTDKKQWLEQYRASSEAMERVRVQELAAMKEEEALRIIQSLKMTEEPWNERPDWSGLVEQQAIFRRSKR